MPAQQKRIQIVAAEYRRERRHSRIAQRLAGGSSRGTRAADPAG
jgi:hypothetical protein